MQYIVKEIHPDPSVGTGAVMVFTTLFAALKHIQKINNNGRLLLDDKEGNLNVLRSVLMERLSSVSLIPEMKTQKRWTITAL
jgi:hypothetical protein